MKTNLPNPTLLNLIDHLISRLLETNWAAAYMLQPPRNPHLLSLKSTHTHLPLHPNSPRNTVPTLPQPNPAHPHPDFLRPSQLITPAPPAPTHPVTASDRLLQSMLTQPFLPGIKSFIGIKNWPVYISPIRTCKKEFL